MSEKIPVGISACLLGETVRFDGGVSACMLFMGEQLNRHGGQGGRTYRYTPGGDRQSHCRR